jgi:adenine-specific DNA-methyltransferase
MNKVTKQSEDLYKEKIAQLKAVYPALFDDEGNLNEEELRDFLNNFASTSEGKYEFNWAGKMSAKRNAFTTSRAMLKPDKDRSVDFDKTENLIIEGDNLEVLKLLQKSYQGKIKCIYIDPPYNTGNDFIYTDNFSDTKQAYWEKSGTTQEGVKLDTNTESQGRYHSNWLNMIYPRLLIARNLLTEEGVIFVSIDDKEVHNLRKLMDEIFGEENVDAFVWRKSGDGRDGKMKNTETFRKDHEYILIAFKNKNKLNKIIEKPNFVNKYENLDNDPRGAYKAGSISKKESASNPSHIHYYQVTSPSGKIFKRQFEISKEKFEELDKDNRIYWGKNRDSVPALKIFVDEQRAITPYSILLSKGTTTEGKKEVRTLFEITDKTDYFDNPKPSLLIKTLVQLATNKDSLILDFFAGSGTTAQAVMELNKEDGGNRKFILVQIPEKTDESSEAYKAGYKKISDICIERVKRVSKKLSEEKISGDLGFKVFTLSPSYFPENLFRPDPEKTEEENKKALEKYIEEASTQLEFKFDEFDLMYEVLLKDGFTLNFKVEKLTKFTKNNIYKVTDGEKHAYVTLDGDLKDETLQKLQDYTKERFICLERAIDTTKKWNLQNMFEKNLWVI